MSELRNVKYHLEMGWQAVLKDIGVSMQDVLRHARLPLDLLMRPSPVVTASEYLRLWEGLAHVLRDRPAFPLYFAQAVTPETFSPPIFACLCSRDLNMALTRIAQYKPIVGPIRMDIRRDDAHTTVAFTGLTESEPLPPYLGAFELAFWVQIARIATRERIVPAAVHMNAALPDLEAYEAYFDTTVRESDFCGITFTAADAQKPFLTVNDAMWDIFEPQLRQRMRDLTQDASFRDRVRACLIEILASGQYSMDDVASRLVMSARTLQRRLQKEDTSFQKVLDELREELARHYLATSDYSSGQIAFLLGYEEPNSFFRAFRSWTGQTPEHIRASIQ